MPVPALVRTCVPRHARADPARPEGAADVGVITRPCRDRAAATKGNHGAPGGVQYENVRATARIEPGSVVRDRAPRAAPVCLQDEDRSAGDRPPGASTFAIRQAVSGHMIENCDVVRIVSGALARVRAL